MSNVLVHPKQPRRRTEAEKIALLAAELRDNVGAVAAALGL